MSSDLGRLYLLRVVPTEVEASMLVARLAAAGIEARIEGGISAGFRAEAPGGARVLVSQRDLERARNVLEVDDEAPEPSPPPPTPTTKQGPIPRQRAVTVWVIIAMILAALILLQAVLW
jgi:hypothetical protein